MNHSLAAMAAVLGLLVSGCERERQPVGPNDVPSAQLVTPAFATEVEPNNTCATAQDVGTVTLPYVLTGSLDPVPPASGDVDFFRVTGPPNTAVMVGTEVLADELLGAFDSGCNPIAFPRFRLVLTIPPDGVLILAVTTCAEECDFDFIEGGEGSYELTIQRSTSLTGQVLGPDGLNVCNTLDPLLGPGSRLRVEATASPGFFAGSSGSTCPDNAFSFDLASGSYFLLAQLPARQGIGTLPWRTMEGIVDADGSATTRDITVRQGTALGGSAQLDGRPAPGVPLVIEHVASRRLAAQAASGADGRWREFFGRTPPFVQNGILARAFAECPLLGTLGVVSPSTDPFVFPTDLSTINCTMVTAPAARFSHDRTRLVLTPMAAEIGGQCQGASFQHLGIGFGVQFPVGDAEKPPHRPRPSSHLFCGGLLIAVEPTVVLSGLDALAGYGLECAGGPEACQDLGLDARLKFREDRAEGSSGKKVTWKYTDAGSTERIGLRVIQRSYDGKAPADYVLFRYSLTNERSRTVRLYAGFFGDWDVGEADFDAFDDAGFTDLNGRLMYAVSMDMDEGVPVGVHAGTLFLSRTPVAGTFFFNDQTRPQSVTDQVRALSGAVKRPTLEPSFEIEQDLRALHSVGPITLKGGEQQDVWMAIVAGETKEQLLANAAAAEADVARRMARPEDDENDDNDGGWTSGASSVAGAAAARSLRSRLLRKNRVPQ